MSTTTSGLTQATVSITSTTVPVSIIPPVFKGGGWGMIASPANTITVRVFAYIAPLPNSAPPDTWPLAPGIMLNDNLFSAASGADAGLSVGWAGVLASPGTSEVDAMWR